MSTDSVGTQGDREFARELLAEIGRSEQHFNALEGEYRKLASAWLLGAFAGMGFVASSHELPLPAGPLILSIALGASLGIQLLWVVDLLAYHRLLLAYFLEGIRLERAHPQLPQVRSNMLKQGSVGRLVRLFYLGCALAPLPAGIAGYLLIGERAGWTIVDLPFALAVLALVSSATALLIKTPNRWVREQVALLDHPKKD